MRRPRAKSWCAKIGERKLEIRYRGRAVAWDQISAPVPARQVKPLQTAPRRNKTVTPKADHPWRHADRKMAPGDTTGVPLADTVRVAASSTSPNRAPFQTRPRGPFQYYEKGDISNVVSKGTFLMSVDKSSEIS